MVFDGNANENQRREKKNELTKDKLVFSFLCVSLFLSLSLALVVCPSSPVHCSKNFKLANVNKVAIMPIEKVYPSVVFCSVSFALYLPKHIFQTKPKLDRAYAWCASPLGILDEINEAVC